MTRSFIELRLNFLDFVNNAQIWSSIVFEKLHYSVLPQICLGLEIGKSEACGPLKSLLKILLIHFDRYNKNFLFSIFYFCIQRINAFLLIFIFFAKYSITKIGNWYLDLRPSTQLLVAIPTVKDIHTLFSDSVIKQNLQSLLYVKTLCQEKIKRLQQGIVDTEFAPDVSLCI